MDDPFFLLCGYLQPIVYGLFDIIVLHIYRTNWMCGVVICEYGRSLLADFCAVSIEKFCLLPFFFVYLP